MMPAREQARREVINDPSKDSIRHWNDVTEEVKQSLDKCRSNKWKTNYECLNAETCSEDLWRLIKHIENKQQENDIREVIEYSS